ncbi:MAG TPA: class A beta-lactamase [Allosphingosinicella sp.]|nr:class A beta-lactamase [Allosphingosinicella sp.]
MIDRRAFLLAGSAAALAACRTRTAAPLAPADTALADIRARLGAGARLGVAAVDTSSGARLALDPDGRYAMCSTFKAPLAAMVLAEAERGTLALDDELAVSRADLVDNSPAAAAALPLGRMTIEAMCAAIVQVSDNAAANLLLARLGGPPAFTAFVRRCGDPATRLDRVEPELNSNRPGDLRDTTTPAAMLGLIRGLLVGELLSPASQARLAGWMVGATTGLDRLRAGLPAGWRAGDKTGTANSANNDIAVAWPPGRPPILIASYIDAPAPTHAERNAAHAAVARAVTAAFTSRL